jgi:hypothetical protein
VTHWARSSDGLVVPRAEGFPFVVGQRASSIRVERSGCHWSSTAANGLRILVEKLAGCAIAIEDLLDREHQFGPALNLIDHRGAFQRQRKSIRILASRCGQLLLIEAVVVRHDARGLQLLGEPACRAPMIAPARLTLRMSRSSPSTPRGITAPDRLSSSTISDQCALSNRNRRPDNPE